MACVGARPVAEQGAGRGTPVRRAPCSTMQWSGSSSASASLPHVGTLRAQGRPDAADACHRAAQAHARHRPTGLRPQPQSSTWSRSCGTACASTSRTTGCPFDPESVEGSKISREAEYQGARIRFTGHLGNARTVMQLDVGFGDAVVPGPIWIDYPELLDFGTPPSPWLHARECHCGEVSGHGVPGHGQQPHEGLL